MDAGPRVWTRGRGWDAGPRRGRGGTRGRGCGRGAAGGRRRAAGGTPGRGCGGWAAPRVAPGHYRVNDGDADGGTGNRGGGAAAGLDPRAGRPRADHRGRHGHRRNGEKRPGRGRSAGHRRRATVLAGTARVHSPAPYDWLAAVLAGRDTRGLDVPPDALAWLKQDPDVPRERYTPDALLRIAVATVRALVGGAPAVLVVEDLHALDPASLNLVAELATTDLPALLLVTSQPAAAAVSPQLTERTLARLGGPAGRRATPSERAAAGRGGGDPRARVRAGRLLAGGGRGRLAAHRRQPVPAQRAARRSRAAAVLERPRADLTAREREVLGLLAEGMANKQIATALGISVRTVTVHVRTCFAKRAPPRGPRRRSGRSPDAVPVIIKRGGATTAGRLGHNRRRDDSDPSADRRGARRTRSGR